APRALVAPGISALCPTSTTTRKAPWSHFGSAGLPRRAACAWVSETRASVSNKAAAAGSTARASPKIRRLRCIKPPRSAIRDDRGRYGLIDRECPHRGADLAFGRLEDGGLRCAFHGWLFDVQGRCLQTPAEPDGSTLCQNIRQRAFPVVERSGILCAYLGAG